MMGKDHEEDSPTKDMQSDNNTFNRDGGCKHDGHDCVIDLIVNEKSVGQFCNEMNPAGGSHVEEPVVAVGPVTDGKQNPAVMKCSHDFENEISKLYELVPDVQYHFDITTKIGEGAFSSVYLAKLRHYPKVNETFALKHILPTTHPSRIENELKCLVKIGGQDNVMGVHMCLRNRDNVVIVMPLFPHDKFQDYLMLMDVEEAREYMRNLLIALRHVHMFDVIHRDVKPSNFLYNRQLRKFALVDFGLASGSFLIDRDEEKHSKTDGVPKPGAPCSRSGIAARIPLSPSKQTTNNASTRRGSAGKEKERKAAKPSGKLAIPCLPSTSSSGSSVDRSGRCDCFGKPMICSLCVGRNNQRAPRAGTAGFRAPEVLLKSPEQDTAVDVWAAGVIFISILSARYPFFRAQEDMGYLAQIISILGSQICCEAAGSCGKVMTLSDNIPPTDLKTACMKLRSVQMSQRPVAGSQSWKLLKSWNNISDDAFDLLYRMLDPNPRTRITARDALTHVFFTRNSSSCNTTP